MYLLFVLGSTAGLYFMFNYLFLGAVQLLVYVGGVVVLIIFAVLLTSHIDEKMPPIEIKKNVASILVSIVGGALCIHVLVNYTFTSDAPEVEDPATVTSIGEKLMNYGEGGYVLPFEVISILLLAAMVSAIIIAKRIKQKQDD